MVFDVLVKRLGAVVVAGALVVGAAACGGGGGENAEVVSEGSEQTTDEAASRDEVERNSTDAGSMRDGVNELTELLEGGDFDGLGQCMEIGVAYMSVSFGALGAMFGGADEMGDMHRELENLQSELPSEIRDDFGVIADAFADFAKELEGTSGNIMDPEFQKRMEDAGAALETAAVTEAQENIEAYLQKECPTFAGDLSN